MAKQQTKKKSTTKAVGDSTLKQRKNHTPKWKVEITVQETNGNIQVQMVGNADPLALSVALSDLLKDSLMKQITYSK